jgi:hypothetical protein
MGDRITHDGRPPEVVEHVPGGRVDRGEIESSRRDRPRHGSRRRVRRSRPGVSIMTNVSAAKSLSAAWPVRGEGLRMGSGKPAECPTDRQEALPRFAHCHRCLSSGYSTHMIPQLMFIENRTDPRNCDEVCVLRPVLDVVVAIVDPATMSHGFSAGGNGPMHRRTTHAQRRGLDDRLPLQPPPRGSTVVRCHPRRAGKADESDAPTPAPSPPT